MGKSLFYDVLFLYATVMMRRQIMIFFPRVSSIASDGFQQQIGLMVLQQICTGRKVTRRFESRAAIDQQKWSLVSQTLATSERNPQRR